MVRDESGRGENPVASNVIRRRLCLLRQDGFARSHGAHTRAQFDRRRAETQPPERDRTGSCVRLSLLTVIERPLPGYPLLKLA